MSSSAVTMMSSGYFSNTGISFLYGRIFSHQSIVKPNLRRSSRARGKSFSRCGKAIRIEPQNQLVGRQRLIEQRVNRVLHVIDSRLIGRERYDNFFDARRLVEPDEFFLGNERVNLLLVNAEHPGSFDYLHKLLPPKKFLTASTSPLIVNSFATTATDMPKSSSVRAVIVPMAADGIFFSGSTP